MNEHRKIIYEVLVAAGCAAALFLVFCWSEQGAPAQPVDTSTKKAIEMHARAKPPKTTVLCMDRRLIGTWRRVGDSVDQQVFFFANGLTGAATANDPYKKGLIYSGGRDKSAPDNNAKYCDSDHDVFGVGTIKIESSGTGAILTWAEDNRPYRIQKVIVLPTIDWRRRAADGGYSWDFYHVCRTWMSRKITIEGLVDDYQFLYGDDRVAPRIISAADADGTLWWSNSDSDPLSKRDHCQPNDHTLIVAEPGPHGVILPHRFDVFSHGGQIYVNGQQMSEAPRSHFEKMQFPIVLGKDVPKNIDSGLNF